jgi:alpha-glucosidase
MSDDSSSILLLYKRLLAARRASPALSEGDWTALAAPDGVLAYERTHGGDRRVVAVNFSDRPVRWQGAGIVEVASDGAGEGVAFGGVLPPDGAVVLR